MFTNTHLTQAMAREAIDHRVRDAETHRLGHVTRTAHQHKPRAQRRLARVRRAANRLA